MNQTQNKGIEKRVESNRDINPGGKYYELLKERWSSPWTHDEKNFRDHVPPEVLDIVDNSGGRLKIKGYSIGDANDEQEDSYTQYLVVAVERRAGYNKR